MPKRTYILLLPIQLWDGHLIRHLTSKACSNKNGKPKNMTKVMKARTGLLSQT